MSYANKTYHNSSNLLESIDTFVSRILRYKDKSFKKFIERKIQLFSVLVFGKTTFNMGLKFDTYTFKKNDIHMIIKFNSNHSIKLGLTKDFFIFIEDNKYNIHIGEYSSKDEPQSKVTEQIESLYNNYFMILEDMYDEYVVNKNNDKLTKGAEKLRSKLMGDILYVGVFIEQS